MSKTLFEKVWDAHLVREGDARGAPTIYIDLHLVHEVTSPQAFEGLRLAGRTVRRPDRTLATVDHNVPTIGRDKPIEDPLAREQIETLERNCAEFGVPIFSIRSNRQGIVHVIGPELGVTQPGMTIVCGDSHTATHGAFGALAVGIGTSEVEHVLATQTLSQTRPKTMRVTIDGTPGLGVVAKDLILGTIGQIGVSGGVGHVIEFAGAAIRALTMEGRMTVCNMTIEGGGRAGMIAPDETTFAYLEGRAGAPKDFARAVDGWRQLPSDPDAVFDTEVVVDAASLAPQVTWGTTPEMVVPVTGRVPTPEEWGDADSARRALAYMGLKGGEAIEDIAGPRSEPPMPMLTMLRMRRSENPRHRPVRTRSANAPMRSSTSWTSATTLCPSTSIVAPRGARSAVCRTARSSVTLMRSPRNMASIRSRNPARSASATSRRMVWGVARFLE